MKVFKPALVIWVIVLALLFSFSPQVLFAQPTSFDILYKTYGTVGTKFEELDGQCVDFVKKSREDLGGRSYGTAKEMKPKAETAGFEVNNVPRVGSVLVLDEVGDSGHVAIVEEVKRDPNNPNRYNLKIRDANVSGPSIIDEQNIVFYKYEEKWVCEDPRLKGKRQHVAGFIHEERTAYEEKKEQAAEYVINVFKEKAGRNPSVEELNMYRKMMFAGENQSKEKLQKYIQTQTARGFLAKLKDLSSLGVWNATFGIPTALAPTTSYGASENTITIAQDQTTKNVEDTGTVRANHPTTHYGFLAATLRSADNQSNNYTPRGRTNFDSAEFPNDPGWDSLIFDGSQGYDRLYLKSVICSAHGQSADFGKSYPVNQTEIGYNSYMEWGYWTVSNVFQIGGVEHYFDLKSNYVYGDKISDAQFATLTANNIKATYSGKAYGTHYSNVSGADYLSGTFSSSVDFGKSSEQITNFNLYVSGDRQAAQISGANGSFKSSGHGTFNVYNTSGGTWKVGPIGGLTENTANPSASGSIYGPNGEAIGGNWHIGEAAGIFQGTK